MTAWPLQALLIVAAHFDGSGDDGVAEDVKRYDADIYAYEECEPVAHEASHLQDHFEALVPYGYENDPGGALALNPCSFRSKTIRLQLQSQIETHSLRVFVHARTSGYPYCQTSIPSNQSWRATEMQNAHERFGSLEFIKRTKDATTRVRVHIDRAVLETPKDERGQARAHLLSMIGGDSEIGALWAAVTEGALFQIQLPDRPSIAASLGPEAQCFRGSVMVPGRKRPAKHLVAMSAELAKTKPGADREGARTILCDDDPVFVLYRVASRYGLPVVSEWAPWFMRELNQRKAITPLLGLGCSPVLVRGNKQTFLRWTGRALRGRLIRIPAENGSISWKLPRTFLEKSNLRPTSDLKTRV